MAHRYFLTAVDGDKAFVTGDEAAHLAKVMRLKPGDCVTLTDGAGFDYKCTATGSDIPYPGEILKSRRTEKTAYCIYGFAEIR